MTTPTDKPKHCQAPCDPPCMRPIDSLGLCRAHWLRRKRGQRLDTPIGAGHGSDINKGAREMTEEELTEETAEETSEVEDCEEETDVCGEEDFEEEEESDESAPASPAGRIVINIFASDAAEALRALREAGLI